MSICLKNAFPIPNLTSIITPLNYIGFSNSDILPEVKNGSDFYKSPEYCPPKIEKRVHFY